jgi:glucokinase
MALMTEPVARREVLLADIGGTNSRFALSGPDGRPERMLIIENDSVADLETAITRYLQESGAEPHAAVLAVAGPLDGSDEVALTNRAWRFRRGALAQRFGFDTLRVVNDFEAIAWALTRLTADDAHLLGPKLPSRPGVKAVFGPGTGLGVAALVPVEGHLHVLATEGGHASFGPHEPDEMEIFARLQREYGSVSAETILSGPGLPRLMHAVDPQAPGLTPEAVVANALAGAPSAQATVRLFVRLLGRFAGDLALTFKAVGGVYIAGGVASRLGMLLDDHIFRAAFEAHPPYQKMLASIPTWLMSRSEPGLLGCAALADQMAAAS